MRKYILLAALLFTSFVLADTPPPNTVKAKTFTGDGVTGITATGTSMNVNVTNTSGLNTVNQGNVGSQAWLFNLSQISGFAPSATNTLPIRISNGAAFVDPTQIRALNSGTDSVTISGSVIATNSANGATGAAVPAQATQVAGSNAGNLVALKVSGSGVLSVDSSGSSISVSNFPPVQAVSQSGPFTVTQGTPPWAENLTQLNGASPSASNALPSRITNGTVFVDPTQIRALSSGTDSVAITAASLPLPAGAATNASQTTGNNSLASILAALGSPFQAGGSIGNTAFGISGTLPSFSATPTFNVGTTNGLALDATVANVQGSATGGAAAIKSNLSGGIYNSTPPTLTNGQQASLQFDVNGQLKTSGTSTITGAITSNQGTSPWVDNVAQFGGSNVVTGTGTGGAGIPRVTVSSDSAVTANAGTNLNTSALALEGGGHLASIDTKLTNPLPISGTVTATVAGVSTAANQTNGSQTTQIVNGANTLSVGASGNILVSGLTGVGVAPALNPVSVSGVDGGGLKRHILTDAAGRIEIDTAQSLPLPAGAATAAGLTTINTTLGSPMQNSGGSVTANAGTNLNTSALALESGGHLASMDLKMPVLGQALNAASVPVVLTVSQLATLTPLSTVTANIGTTNGLALDSTLSALSAKFNSLGQKTMAASAPVVFASDQSAIPVSGTLTVTGVSTAANQTNASQKTQIVDGAGLVYGPATSQSGVNAVPVAIAASNFYVSAANTTVAQLTAGATFTGTPETVLNQPDYSILITSDQPGTLHLLNCIDAACASIAQNLVFTIAANAGFAQSGPINGNYFKVTFTNTGASTTTTLNVNTAYGSIQAATNLNNHPVALNEVSGIAIDAFPTKAIRVSSDPKSLFDDTFATSSVLDTTNRWNAGVASGGGVAAAVPVGGGNVTLGTGTTANGYSYLQSQVPFPQVAPGWLEIFHAINLEFPVLTNAYRFWGVGTVPGTPTASAPLTDAIGFEVATNGKMFAVSYSGGTRNVIQDLSSATGNSMQPADASVHKYLIWYRGDLSYWAIDTRTNVVATMLTGAPGPINNTLPLALVAIANSTPPGSNVTLNDNAVFVGDTTGSASQIADGTFPWRKATVSSAGALKVDGSAVTQPVQNAVLNISGTAAALNADALAQTDLQGYQCLKFQVTGTFTGTLTLQGDDDNATPLPLVFKDVSGVNVAPQTTVVNTAGGSVFQYPISARYARLRMTAYTSGTATATAQASTLPCTPDVGIRTVLGSGTFTTSLASTTLTSGLLTSQAVTTDIASAARTVTFTSASITPSQGSMSEAYGLNVTAVSGTTPTMDCQVAESNDTAANFQVVYQFERITTTGQYWVPMHKISGNRIQYTCTIAGTTPSFTFTLFRIDQQTHAPILKRFFDRTIVPNTLNSTTAAFNIEGCVNVSYGAAEGAITTTAATFDLELSEDGSVYEPQTITITPGANSASSIQAIPISSKFAKVIVTSAGSGATLNYAWLRCMGH